MIKRKNIKSKDILKYCSIILFLISVIGFGYVIPTQNINIENIELEIEDINYRQDTLLLNLNNNAHQFQKIISTKQTIEILDELNSSKKDFFDKSLRYQMYTSIGILRQDTVNKTEKIYYDSLNILEINDIIKSNLDNSIEDYNYLTKQKKELNEKLITLKNNRNYKHNIFLIFEVLSIIIVIFIKKD